GIKPGSFSSVPVVAWDLLPTIADLAGYRGILPDDVDGVSFRTVLHEMGTEELPRVFTGLYFNRYSDSYGHVAIRVGDYKLIRFQPLSSSDCVEPLVLFDLSCDPGERHNLADKQPDRVRELSRHLDDYMNHVRASYAEHD